MIDGGSIFYCDVCMLKGLNKLITRKLKCKACNKTTLKFGSRRCNSTPLTFPVIFTQLADSSARKRFE